jgi:two-component system NtrC family sensor kinase
MVKFRKSLQSLAGKLILTVGLLMASGSLLFGYIFITYEEEVMMRNLLEHAASSADLIKRGIHYGMLTANRQLIQQTVDVIGSGRDIRFIRVFAPDGRVAYKSLKEDAPPPEVDLQALFALAAPRAELITWQGQRTLHYLMPIENEPACYSSACHHHSPQERVLGVLEAGFSTARVDALIRQNRVATLLMGGAFVGVISVFLCIILYKFVSKPVALLEEGMRRIGRGQLDTPIEIHTRDEMGMLAQAFNQMAQELKRYRQRMESWTQSLEAEVRKKTQEIMRAQEELINAEKLASLGRMAAGVAHELNSPLTGIVTFAHLLKDRLPPQDKEAQEDLQVIIEQAERCSKIIKGLLGFSRKAAYEKVELSLNDLLEATLGMVRNQARFHNIQFRIEMAPDLRPVVADPNQLQQVFLNMLINAADAMEERGQITMCTRNIKVDERDFVEVEFTDTGPGIPPEHLGKIFEPFFTTKPVGKGTGLGLSVSYGIVKRHGGDILVRSSPGKGASFFIRLPASPQGEARA